MPKRSEELNKKLEVARDRHRENVQGLREKFQTKLFEIQDDFKARSNLLRDGLNESVDSESKRYLEEVGQLTSKGK